MRSNLKSGTFYGKVQKFGERFYKPWEMHKLYQKFIEDTHSKLDEDDFNSHICSRKIKTVCIKDLIDVSNGKFITDHIWTDFDIDIWKLAYNKADEIKDIIKFDGISYEYYTESSARTKYDYTIEITKIYNGNFNKAYNNALKIHNSQIEVLNNWIKENL